MTQIMLTPEQTAIIAGTAEPIVLLDATGKRVGQVTRDAGIVFSAKRIAEAKRRLRTETGGATTAEVLERLQKLGE